jgi:hypothetical protein
MDEIIYRMHNYEKGVERFHGDSWIGRERLGASLLRRILLRVG